MRYISKRAKIGKILFENTFSILGRSIVEDFVYIGNNVIIGYPVRKKILNLKHKGINILDKISNGSIIGKNTIIRTNCIIYENVYVGENVEFGHNVIVRENTRIGNKTKIGTNTIIDGNVKIGNNVNIQSSCYIPPKTIIGNNVFLGPCVVITNDKYPPSTNLKGVIIEDSVVIGANAVLLAGIKICKNAVIGAGSVVTKDVPEDTVVVGNPARKIYKREEYERKKYSHFNTNL